MQKLSALLIIAAFLFSCKTNSTSEDSFSDDTKLEDGGEFIEYNNPPAEGFDLEGSDMLAMLLADKCMLAMGGRDAWENSRFITWDFLGRRDHLWDKMTGNIRIEDAKNKITILMNINTMKGEVFKDGSAVSDSATYFLQKGYEWWVNDSYWLAMPYKLKDSGVTLKYLGDDTAQSGKPADLIQMTFKDVGVTPQNMYEVWIDTDTKLVTQWAYYPDSSAIEPRFTAPWDNYEKYGDILLSSNRGDVSLKKIGVLQEVPSEIFENYDIRIASLR